MDSKEVAYVVTSTTITIVNGVITGVQVQERELGKLDYSDIWKVSSTTCTVSGTTNIGEDPTEKVPTITAGLCSQATKVSFRYNSISSRVSKN